MLRFPKSESSGSLLRPTPKQYTANALDLLPSPQSQTPPVLHPLHPSPGPPKSCPREGPWPLVLVVGAVISHRVAPVLPTPLDGVSPLVHPHVVWWPWVYRNWSKKRPLVLLRVVGRGAAFLEAKPIPTCFFPPRGRASWPVRLAAGIALPSLCWGLSVRLPTDLVVFVWSTGAVRRYEPAFQLAVAHCELWWARG